MSEVKVNKISPRSGTTVTLGDSGDTFTIPSGVTFDASSGSLSGTLTTAAQPNITSVGTLTSFASTGIDDNATSTAITIDSSERVGLGRTPTNAPLEVQALGLVGAPLFRFVGTASNGNYMRSYWYESDNTTQLARLNVDGNVKMSFGTNSATPLAFITSGSEAMRIDSSGNVGIGTTSPESALDVGAGTITQRESNVRNTISSSSTGFEFIVNSTSLNVTRNFVFKSAKSGGSVNERMRIDSNGSLFIGHTAEPTGSTGGAGFSNDTYGRKNLICATTTTNNVELIEFRNPNGTVGTIKTSGSSTSFNTSSDYRLKENVNYDFDATSRLKQLKPARFNFIADANTTVDGFLAHEVSSVVPEAITGEKDAVQVWEEGDELPEGVSVGDNKLDENGNTIPEYQGIDQSKLVPLLVKTIQELEARITTLENA